MLQCIKFILEYTAKFCGMLFNINLGGGLSLGSLLCILFIFLPIAYRFLTILKHDVLGELDEMYDESRPREVWSTNEHTSYNPTTGKIKQTFYGNHIRSRSRRYKA